jgi:predicted CoA-binding protein
MIDPEQARAFLHCGRIAVVGASDDPKSFGGTVRHALVDHGVDVVTVNPNVATIDGGPCYPSLADVPGRIDGVLVMVSGTTVEDVVRAASDLGIERVWLFKGLGGPGAASDDAVRLAHELGLDVVAGACPLMFLDPVRGAHRFHRTLRRLHHAVGEAA